MVQNPQVLGNQLLIAPQQLLIAAQNGNNETVEALLSQSIPIDAIDCLGFTPLMCASLNGRKDACELLLTHKANVNSRNDDGSTPLMLATRWGRKDVCKLLLTHNAQVGARNNADSTPLILATKHGHVDVCMLLLEANAQVGTRNNVGATPLILAAINHYKDVCKCLIDDMSRKQHDFTKNIQAIISFLGMRKKNECLRLIGHDMVLRIAQMVFDMAKKDNVNVVAQINAIKNEALKTELLNYYQTQLSALQGAQPKDCLE
jgi:ankyrin repeat protein